MKCRARERTPAQLRRKPDGVDERVLRVKAQGVTRIMTEQ